METASAHAEKGTFDYLDELRRRMLHSLLFFLGTAVIGIFFSTQIVSLMLSFGVPENVEMVSLTPYENIAIFFNVILFLSLLLTIPFIAYQIIAFVLPALNEKERSILIRIPLFAFGLFVLGCTIGFFLTRELIIPFLAQITQNIGVSNTWSVAQLLSFYLYLTFAMGLLFQMPLICAVLVSLGFLTPDQLSAYRKQAFIGNLVISAIITPTPDATSMIVMAIPLVLLFEFTILLTRFIYRKKNKQIEVKEC